MNKEHVRIVTFSCYLWDPPRILAGVRILLILYTIFLSIH